MGNDSLRVGDRVVALNEIEARVVAAEAKVRNEGTLFSGATLTDAAAGFWLIADAQALLSEVRRLRAVEAAADTTVRNPERHFMECAALAHTVTVGDADTCVPFDVVRCDCFLGDLVDALAAAPDTEGGTDAR